MPIEVEVSKPVVDDIHDKKIADAHQAGQKEGYLQGLFEAHKVCMDILKYWDGPGRDNPVRAAAGKQTKYIAEQIKQIVNAKR